MIIAPTPMPHPDCWHLKLQCDDGVCRVHNDSVIGNYVAGSIAPALSSVTNQVEWALVDGNGNINGLQDSSGPNGSQSNQPVALTYQMDASGRALLDSNPGGTLQGIMYLVSPSSALVLSTDANPVLSSFATGTASN